LEQGVQTIGEAITHNGVVFQYNAYWRGRHIGVFKTESGAARKATDSKQSKQTIRILKQV
jgi:hypothetical protein